MFVSRRISVALGVACLLLLTAASASLASGPATVTVRVEGLNETKLPAIQVITSTAPVVNGKEGSCLGTSVLGALQVATGGDWSGKWYGAELGYEVATIEGESHAFTSGYFWELWIDHVASEKGVCAAEAEPGQQLLFAPCPESVAECPTLGIEAPASANVGEAVPVTVTRYNAKGEPFPAVGATVTGAGATTSTQSGGHATVSFSGAGSYTLTASANENVRAETEICVHTGNDGTCGTSAPAAPPSHPGGAPAQSAAPVAFVARLGGLIEEHHYPRSHSPRLLSGSISAPAAVTSISLRLRRTYHGRCWAYDGARARLVRVRCREGSYFKIASGGDSFSYLLPAPLPPGRYVLDVQAADALGGQTTLARRASRIVFFVD